MWTDRSHNAVVAEKDARIADLKAALAVQISRYEGAVVIAEGLREELREAKRPPAPTSTGVVGTPREVSLVAKAIQTEAGGNVRLQEHFARVARDFRRDHPNASEEEVAAQIGWTTTADETRDN